MRSAFTSLFSLAFCSLLNAGEKPELTDYCERLEQEIHGKKHGFLAGNVTYYVGRHHASWKLYEEETIGLTHPFHHDLRGRGAAASIITTSKPDTLQFSGQSFSTRNSVSSSATIRHDAKNKALVISEGGTMKARPDPDGPEHVGPSIYPGMSTVMSSSRQFAESLVTRRDEDGIQHYIFSVPCDPKGTVVFWAMHHDEASALQAPTEIIKNHQSLLSAKTAEMDRQLNGEIPSFRCPDDKFVDINYSLGSLYLMYHIEVGPGWELEGHTQTAVNNFLGLHRYDAAFPFRINERESAIATTGSGSKAARFHGNDRKPPIANAEQSLPSLRSNSDLIQQPFSSSTVAI